MNIALVINRSSGGAVGRCPKQMAAALAAPLAAAGHVVQVRSVEGGRMGKAVAKAVADPAVDVIVVGGGDGSISRALGPVMASGKMLGILPLGSMNYFATDLGIPADPVAAAAALARGVARRVDVGEINGRPFLVWVCLGLVPAFLRSRDRQRQDGRSLLAALARATLHCVEAYPVLDVDVTCDGRSRRLHTPFVVVTNNACGDGAPLGLRRECLDGGELVVHCGRNADPLAMMQLGVQAALGQWAGNDHMDRISARRVEITSPSRKLLVSIDGEVEKLALPLRFAIFPRALTVLAPQG